jgi:hypothetical protein
VYQECDASTTRTEFSIPSDGFIGRRNLESAPEPVRNISVDYYRACPAGPNQYRLGVCGERSDFGPRDLMAFRPKSESTRRIDRYVKDGDRTDANNSDAMTRCGDSAWPSHR